MIYEYEGSWFLEGTVITELITVYFINPQPMAQGPPWSLNPCLKIVALTNQISDLERM